MKPDHGNISTIVTGGPAPMAQRTTNATSWCKSWSRGFWLIRMRLRNFMAETTKMMHVHKIHISNRLPNRMFSTAFEMLPATLRKVAITRERTASRFWRNWTRKKSWDGLSLRETLYRGSFRAGAKLARWFSPPYSPIFHTPFSRKAGMVWRRAALVVAGAERPLFRM